MSASAHVTAMDSRQLRLAAFAKCSQRYSVFYFQKWMSSNSLRLILQARHGFISFASAPTGIEKIKENTRAPARQNKKYGNYQPNQSSTEVDIALDKLRAALEGGANSDATSNNIRRIRAIYVTAGSRFLNAFLFAVEEEPQSHTRCNVMGGPQINRQNLGTVNQVY